MMTAGSGRAAALAVLCALPLIAACATTARPTPPPPTVDQMIDLYAKRVEQLAAQRKEEQKAEIVRLDVSKADGRVDLDVRDAPLMTVLSRVLDASGRPYRVSGAPLQMRVTEVLHDVPLEAACSELLAIARGRCAWSDGVLVAELPGGEPPATPAASTPEEKTAVTRVVLRNLSAARASKVLEGLYPTTTYEPSPVHFGIDEATNSVALTGAPADVKRAAAFLIAADVGPQHVMIEANIFAVEVSQLESLGAHLSGSAGPFSDVTVNLGSLLAGGIGFTHIAGADNITAFTAMIDVLLSTDRARVLARPFVGVASGEQATIAVTDDRQVAVLSQTGFAPVTTTVSSGVQLKFGAVVRPGGMIHLGISVEQSSFVPTVEGAVSEVARSTASTTMEVPSGQPVVIGGLSLHRSTTSKTGIPWLRDVPVLGWLFGSHGATLKDAQLIVVVTPREWQPGMTHPEGVDEVTPAVP